METIGKRQTQSCRFKAAVSDVWSRILQAPNPKSKSRFEGGGCTYVQDLVIPGPTLTRS